MKKSTFYLQVGSLQRKYQKTLFFKGYIHLQRTNLTIGIFDYSMNQMMLMK